MKILIENGLVYDPKHGVNGEQRDIFVADGIICEPFSGPETTIDARGKAVTPGGIVVNAHVAFFGTHHLRNRLGFPTPEAIGKSFASLGITHAVESLMTPQTAGFVHHEMGHIPFVDTSALLAVAMTDIEKWIMANDEDAIVDLFRGLRDTAGAVGIAVYEPYIKYEQEFYVHKNKPMDFILQLLESISSKLDQRIFLHACPGLLDQLESHNGNFHLLDFHKYIADETDTSKALRILANGITADICFGNGAPCLSIGKNGDGVNLDLGFSRPLTFSIRNDSTDASSLTEMAGRPEHMAISADPLSLLHGGHFRPPEIDFYDAVRMTTANPAGFVGLTDKGHLGIGAAADIAVYEKNAEQNAFDPACKFLIKGGKVVISNGSFTGEQPRKTTYFKKGDRDASDVLNRFFQPKTVRASNLFSWKLLTNGAIRAI